MINEDALQEAAKEGAIETAKLVPFLAPLIAGVRKYHEYIEEEQKAEFVAEIYERLKKLEADFTKEWHKTIDENIIKKIVASALNAEYADKIKYFANAFFNASNPEFQQNKNKFVEVLRNISLPALELLAKEKILHEKRGYHYSQQVLAAELVNETKWDPFLVEACIKELYTLGVFSSSTRFYEDGRKKEGFDEGISAFTTYTEQFIDFIKYPE